MAKLFIDVGGHVGETVEAVVDPVYEWDTIYSLEPVKECAQRIRALHLPRVNVMSCGLSSAAFTARIYNPGSVGASIFADAPAATDEAELCEFIAAPAFIRQVVGVADQVWMKLNCEGSELDIVESLLDTGLWAGLTHVMLDLDARKIPSQQARVDRLLERLQHSGVRNCEFPEDYMYHMGSHFGGIRNWLNKTGARSPRLMARAKSVLFHVKNILTWRHHAFYKLQVLRRCPERLVRFYYQVKRRRTESTSA